MRTSRARILIVNKSFEVGGIESALINMANELQNYYDVDLLIYNPEGPLKNRLKDGVRVLEPSWRLRTIGIPLSQSVKCGSMRMAIFRIVVTLWAKLFDNRLPLKLICRHQKKLEGYDLAIAYHQEQRKRSVVSGFTRIIDQCVDANCKVTWIHYDAQENPIDESFNVRYYQRIDRIVCVSESVRASFANAHPNLKEKLDVCYNFLDYDALHQKSQEEPSITFPEHSIKCFTACRLTREKALPRAVSALAPVFRKNSALIWYIAGDGVERAAIEKAVAEAHLEKQIIILGYQSNPYAYMRIADVVLNLSYHEAAPMVYLEAKALHTPVFTTITSSSAEMLGKGKGAFLCDNSEEGIQKAFDDLLVNVNRLDEARRSLDTYSGNNDASLKKIEFLIKNG
jgi:glycosyltransferase involved in cell wall biosynthesis